MAPSSPGFVYILTNESIPGMVKIGYTNNLAEDRGKEIYKTGVPTPFEVAFRVQSVFPQILEQLTHDTLESFRVNDKREFFRVTPGEAIDAILYNRQFVDGISTYTLIPKKLLINKGDHALLSMKAGQLLFVYSYPNFPDGEQDIIDIWQVHTDGDTLELFGTDAKYTSSFSSNDPFSVTDPLPYLNRTGTAVNDEMNGKEALLPGDRLLWIDDSDPDKFQHVLYEMNTYCQIISRTRKPVINEDGIPLLLNCLTRELDALSEPIRNCIRSVLSFSLPDILAKKITTGDIAVEKKALERPVPEDWLPALIKKKKSTRTK